MFHYVHNLDPVMLALNLPLLGSVSIEWYGVMYVIGTIALMFAIKRYSDVTGLGWSWNQVSDIGFFMLIGAILGGRLGYLLFYTEGAFFSNPSMFFSFKQGGMSFHGGFLGVWVAAFIYARIYRLRYWCLIDVLAIGTPLALFFGRVGNFINGELWGAPTQVPWAIVFPLADELPRHPTMLYEAILEGLVLFVIVWWVARVSKHRYLYPGAAFITGYGVFRILIEFLREPDAHLGYLLGTDWLTMGMVLSAPLVIAGLWLFTWPLWSEKRRNQNSCVQSFHKQ